MTDWAARHLRANLGVDDDALDDLFRCHCGARVVLEATRQGDLHWAHSQWSGDPDHTIGLSARTASYPASKEDT